tara:strand:+ start:2208 stop:2915 length:708 start_codon:yes stop_codon:yes gene_type:complete
MFKETDIVFDPVKHTYTHTSAGLLTSATTVLGKFKKPFDKMFHATRVAKRECVNVEQVLEMWEYEKNKACDRGTDIHKMLEDYIMLGEIKEHYGWLFKAYNSVVDRAVGSVDKVLCENIVYNTEYKVAGMADLIYNIKGDKFIVGDFKTNKKFNFHSQYGEHLLAPVDHLQNCEFNVYALQLSLYAYMYEVMTNKKCAKCVIFYLKDNKFLPYHVNYMREEVKAILTKFNLQYND